MNLFAILATMGLGFLTGLFNGMFGIGGGAMITPGLLAIFSLLKVPEGVLTHLAVGTSLTYIFIVSSVTFFFYARFGVGMTRERFFLFLSALLGGLMFLGYPLHGRLECYHSSHRVKEVAFSINCPR